MHDLRYLKRWAERTRVANAGTVGFAIRGSDPFRLTENTVRRTITDNLNRERDVGMTEVGELLGTA